MKRTPVSVGTRLLALGAAAVLLLLDQWLKRLAESRLSEQGRPLLRGILGLRYTKNTGISFSMLGDSPAAMAVVSAVTALAMLAGIWLMLSGRLRAAPLWAAALIVAGGTGNLVDRLRHGFVVDYLEFLFMRFAVFNFADVCITCGVAVLAVWILWDEARRKRAMP